MGAAWNGSTTITITGTGNTLSSVCTDVNDVTVMQSMGGGVYEVYPQYARYFNISNGGELTIGDSSDFSVSEKLRFPFYSNAYGRIYCYPGGMLKMYGDAEIILNYNCTSAQYPDYSYLYGSLHFEGNATYKPKFLGARRLHFGCNNTATTAVTWANAEITMIYCIIGECHRNYIYWYFNYGFPDNTTLNHITLYNHLYTGVAYYLVQQASLTRPMNPPPIQDLIIDDTKATIIMYYMPPHIKDSTISISRSVYHYASGKFDMTTPRTDLTWVTQEKELFKKCGQPIDYFHDNVTYNTVYSYSHYLYNGATMVLKDSSANKHCLGYGGATFLCWDSDYFYDTSPVLDSYGSSIRVVFLLEVTVNDEYSSPLDDAIIRINQKNDEEIYHCWSGTNGKIISMFGLGGVLLANKAKVTSSETAAYWSDDSNSTYHTITVSKDGYQAHTENVVMDQDRVVTIQLRTTANKVLNQSDVIKIAD